MFDLMLKLLPNNRILARDLRTKDVFNIEANKLSEFLEEKLLNTLPEEPKKQSQLDKYKESHKTFTEAQNKRSKASNENP